MSRLAAELVSIDAAPLKIVLEKKNAQTGVKEKAGIIPRMKVLVTIRHFFEVKDDIVEDVFVLAFTDCGPKNFGLREIRMQDTDHEGKKASRDDRYYTPWLAHILDSPLDVQKVLAALQEHLIQTQLDYAAAQPERDAARAEREAKKAEREAKKAEREAKKAAKAKKAA